MTEADLPQPDPELPSTEPVHRGRSGDELSEEKIGPYTVVRELGRGGQGLVYLAEDTRLGRRVALKVLTSWGAATEQVVERFRREAAIASRLEHPGICTVYETGTAQGVPYMAMRLVEGESLSTRIASATTEGVSEALSFMDLEEDEPAADTEADAATLDTAAQSTQAEVLRIAKLMEAAARALHTAHEAGVIHRDIKPGNIMVTPEGDPVLLDFGLARESDGDQPTLTQTGDIFGTPAYMAPEQLLAQRMQVDRRADVWALGVTLFECLCLKRPFEAPTRDGLYQQILHRDPPDLRKLNKSIPKDLAVIVQTATEKDRDRRYQTALDFAEDLRRFRTFEPIQAKPVSQLTKLVRWTQRNPAVATLTAALFLAMATGLIWIWSQKRALTASNTQLQAKTEEAQASAAALSRTNDDLKLKTEEAEASARRAEESAAALALTNRELQEKTAEAKANARRAEEKTAEAEANARAARANLVEWERLADGRRLDDLLGAANSRLWPAVPTKIPAYEEWIAAAKALTAKRAQHAAALDALRGRGQHDDEGDGRRFADARSRLADIAEEMRRSKAMTKEATSALREFETEIDDLERVAAAKGAPVDDRAVSRLQQRSASAEAAILKERNTMAKLVVQQKRAETESVTPRSWKFSDEGDQLRHDKLRDLVAGLGALIGEPGPTGVTIAGIEQRVSLARELQRRLESTDVGAWARCVADVGREGSPYMGLELEPIPGLVPLGRDRGSNLWEFWHVASGQRPQWDGEPLGVGTVRLHPSSGQEGIVMVLVPGGTFRMGAMKPDADHAVGEPNVDVEAQPREGPVHDVTLESYFIAKHEVSQGQWSRLWGKNPSSYQPGTWPGVTSRMAVTNVDWAQCRESCRRWGLELPTESRWEHACRAGTTTRFFTGHDVASLLGFANIADVTYGAAGGAGFERDFDDGMVVQGAIGGLKANPFGLHDVHGNVFEWCLDGHDVDAYGKRQPRVGDGLRGPLEGVRQRVARGGCFNGVSGFAFSAFRHQHGPTVRNADLGFRPALSIR